MNIYCFLKIRVVGKETLEMTTILIKDNIMCFPHTMGGLYLGAGDLENWT
jgi:hypothetical protein